MPERLRTFPHRATRLPVLAALGLIAIYQRTLSPVLPALLGPGCGCRFTPSCSHYAAGALRRHGLVIGSFLALRRVVKCSPLHPGGLDPVPPARRDRRAKPRCRSVTPPVRHLRAGA